jgi:hypothetical protein
MIHKIKKYDIFGDYIAFSMTYFFESVSYSNWFCGFTLNNY